MAQIIENLAEIADRYDALFCDLWGCVHNGLTPFPAAADALREYRAGGGKVILLTNAPRPRAGVRKHLDQMGLPEACYDDIATSGDSARAAMFTGAVGQKVYFIGEDRDQTFFKPLNLIDDPLEITQTPLAEAEGIVCCGPFDPHADPSVMRETFLYAKTKGMKLLCANPDLVVDRGESREYCAGSLAALYTEMGGTSLYFGKPHPPVYDLARRRLTALGNVVPEARILCVGDGIHTDISGAMGEGLDSLFISGGLAAAETKTVAQPDPAALDQFFADQKMTATYSIGFLR